MRRRKKRYIALLIGAAIIFNQPMVSYSYNKGAESIDLSSANQLREVVYLTGGQGATSIGDGTPNNPLELNVKGKVIDKTIHSGGIMAYSNSEVVINLGDKTGVAIIDTEKQKATTDVNIKDEAVLTNANLGNIINLTLENGSTITMAENSKFEVDNLNIYDGSLLDLRGVVGSVNVKGTFRGEVDDSSAGSIFLDDDTSLQIGGDVEGTTILNTFRFNIIPLKEN